MTVCSWGKEGGLSELGCRFMHALRPLLPENKDRQPYRTVIQKGGKKKKKKTRKKPPRLERVLLVNYLLMLSSMNIKYNHMVGKIISVV